jgi:hypothetical protein
MSHDELTQWDHAARSALTSELGITLPTTDVQLLLDIARDAAHAVNRPAAPITTYLLGFAAGSGASLDQAAAALRNLAGEWDLGLHRE